jgi:hypothetical protein
VPHDIVEPKTGSKKKLVMQLDRDVQVCEIFLCYFLNTPYFEILLLLLFWRGVMLSFFLFFLLEHILFSLYDPSLLLQDYKKRNLFGTLEYLFLVDGWHVYITPGVGGVSMYICVYVISIMEA